MIGDLEVLKKLAPYFVAVATSIAIFIGGFYFGIRMFTAMKSTTMLQDNFIESTQIVSALNYLDEGKEEQARRFLILNLDAAILSIDALAKNGS